MKSNLRRFFYFLCLYIQMHIPNTHTQSIYFFTHLCHLCVEARIFYNFYFRSLLLRAPTSRHTHALIFTSLVYVFMHMYTNTENLHKSVENIYKNYNKNINAGAPTEIKFNTRSESIVSVYMCMYVCVCRCVGSCLAFEHAREQMATVDDSHAL